MVAMPVIPFPCPAAVRSGSRRAGIRLPVDTQLTPRVLLAAAQRLATDEIGELVDALIDELNRRDGDADLEPDDE